MTLPPISNSITTAFNNGFTRLDKAAVELSNPASLSLPIDSVELSPNAIDPTLAGIRDLMLARLQVGAGAMLLHAYNSDRKQLINLLNPENPG